MTQPLLGNLPADVMARISTARTSPPTAQKPVHAPIARPAPSVTLSAEQQRLVDVVKSGRDAIVDATVGSGKTTAIQQLCSEIGQDQRVLYLTYSKLLKRDAQERVGYAKVQNFHGIVYPWLLALDIRCGISESIARFNENFARVVLAGFPSYDVVVVDEYQDLTEEYAQLLRNVKSINPAMQVVLVGDMEQKVRSDTVLDVRKFVGELCNNPVQVPFTQSFRIGPELGELLSEAWNKPVVGVNTSQKVRSVDLGEALRVISKSEPGDLLCLGSRNGEMSRTLNAIEKQLPQKFNKNTVYASIRDSDNSAEYGPDTAVFTTFDSSKGLERKTVIVFDYEEDFWDMRLGFPSVDPVVLRNVFLVAASRGKEQVLFVRSSRSGASIRDSIGFIPVDRFTGLPKQESPTYEQAQWASQAFDFKYAENVQECFELLERTRLDDGTGEEIDIERADGLIDLSPAVGHYQEVLYFDGYDAAREIEARTSEIATRLSHDLGASAWRDALILTAVDTDQMRYADQVKRQIPAAAVTQLRQRLATRLPVEAQVQVPVEIKGWAANDNEATEIAYTGLIDAVHENSVYELKFTTELSHPMFLQLGLYLAITGRKYGVLWNTRTDERWKVQVPNRSRFLDAVTKCVSKQYYDRFSLNEPMLLSEPEDEFSDNEPVW